jgi:hypothetical protein
MTPTCPKCGSALHRGTNGIEPIDGCLKCCEWYPVTITQTVSAATIDAGNGPAMHTDRARMPVHAPDAQKSASGQGGRKKRATAAQVPTEHAEQVALIEWANANAASVPELAMLFAIPNSGAGAQKGRAGWLKAEGVKPGVPDLMLPIARNGFHGMFLELKRTKGGVVSEDQACWIVDLCNAGYSAYYYRGWERAARNICAYLGIDPAQHGLPSVADALRALGEGE